MKEKTQMISEFNDLRDMLKQQYQEVYSHWLERLEKIDDMSQEEKIKMLELVIECIQLGEHIYQMECKHLHNCLEESLPHILCKRLNEVRASNEARVDILYSQYDEMRKKGLSFQERLAKLDTDEIRKREAYISVLVVTPETILVRPAQYWLPISSGYDKMKETGVTEFVRHNFMFIYDKKNNNENN